MINQELLAEATNKFKTSNDDIKLEGNIIDLLMKCYIKYDQSKRGNTLQKLIIEYLGKDVLTIPATWNCGDFALGVESFKGNKLLSKILKKLDYIIGETKVKDSKSMIKMRNDIIQRFFEIVSTFYEIKTSYLNDKGSYTIGNIRTYQNYHNLIVLLVDCEDSFNYKLLSIPKEDLKEFKMHHQHGTKESNNDTKNPHLSFHVKKGSDIEDSLKKWELPGGFEGLNKVCKIQSSKVRRNSSKLTKEQYDYIINDEVKLFFSERGFEDYVIDNEIDIIPYIYKKFRNIKKSSYSRGESYWENDMGEVLFYYQNRSYIVYDSVLEDISEKFNLTYKDVMNYLSVYFDLRYPNLKHYQVLEN
jgi:hypothetical protein